MFCIVTALYHHNFIVFAFTFLCRLVTKSFAIDGSVFIERLFGLSFLFSCIVTNTESVEFVLIRWLTPHEDSLIRDSQQRPIAPPPLDINHGLWSYSRNTRHRLTANVVKNHTNFYGDTQLERDHNVNSERDAYFDLVPTESLLHFINYTPINTESDTHTILETITIPFEETTLNDF